MKIKAKIAALVASPTPGMVQLQTGLVDENGTIIQYMNVTVTEDEAIKYWTKREKVFTWTLDEE